MSALDLLNDAADALSNEHQIDLAHKLRCLRRDFAELLDASRQLLEVSEIAAMVKLIPAPENADGPLPRTRAVLARLGAIA